MAGNMPLSAATVNQQIAADAAYMRSFYDWAKKRYQEWNQNAGTTTLLGNAGISVPADQNAIIALIGDMNRLIQVFEGTNPGSFTDMRFDCAAVSGLG